MGGRENIYIYILISIGVYIMALSLVDPTTHAALKLSHTNVILQLGDKLVTCDVYTIPSTGATILHTKNTVPIQKLEDFIS